MAELISNSKLFVNKHGRHGMSQAREREKGDREREREKAREREHSYERQREQINRSRRLVCVGELRNARAFCCCPQKGGRSRGRGDKQEAFATIAQLGQSAIIARLAIDASTRTTNSTKRRVAITKTHDKLRL